MSLQALRGIAASAVMVYHAAHFTAQKTGAAWLEMVFSGKLGFYGVLVFFVLSGFLMEAAVRRYDAKTFLLHRFARLYPTYWVIFLGLFFAQSIRLHSWESIPWAALTLLPLGEMARPLHVEWTLLYEVFFYGVCALLCFWRRAHFTVLIFWLAAVAFAVLFGNQFGTVMQPTLLQIPFSAWNVGFIFGSLAGFATRFSWSVEPATLWLTGLALILISELINPGPQLFLSGPGVALIVLALVRAPGSDVANAGLGKRSLFVLGEFSYGLYLAHSLSIQIALQYVPAARLTDPIAVFAAMIGVGLAVGMVAGCIDTRLYRLLKGRIDQRTMVRNMSKDNIVAS